MLQRLPTKARAGTHNKADIRLFLGATGSGKSARVKAALMAEPDGPLMVWDFMHEYGEFGKVFTRLSELAKFMAQPGNRATPAVYQPDAQKAASVIDADFSGFCKIAYAIVGCVVLVEELSFVTKPSYAPPAWRSLLVTGRHRGLRILGTSQRPALVDKTVFSQCTLLNCGRLDYEAEAGDAAKKLRIEPLDLVILEPLEFYEWRTGMRGADRGKTEFVNGQPKNVVVAQHVEKKPLPPPKKPTRRTQQKAA